MNVTHGITLNNRIHGELKNPDFTPGEEIRRLLKLLDGKRRYALVLWALPEKVPFDLVDHRRWPEEYIQAAGSFDRLTVEVRQLIDNEPKQFVVGRESGHGDTAEVIEWDSFQTEVRSNEVFSSEEAGDIFSAYYETGSVPPSYRLRVLKL